MHSIKQRSGQKSLGEVRKLDKMLAGLEKSEDLARITETAPVGDRGGSYRRDRTALEAASPASPRPTHGDLAPTSYQARSVKLSKSLPRRADGLPCRRERVRPRTQRHGPEAARGPVGGVSWSRPGGAASDLRSHVPANAVTMVTFRPARQMSPCFGAGPARCARRRRTQSRP
jgi:hypothetical protein